MLPDLLSAAQAAEDRFKEAEKAVELQKKIDSLKNELVWAHVKEKRDVSYFQRYHAIYSKLPWRIAGFEEKILKPRKSPCPPPKA